MSTAPLKPLQNLSFYYVETTKTLIVALTEALASCLDYCKSLLISFPFSKVSPLQSLLNAESRLIFESNGYTAASTLGQSLHWLPIHLKCNLNLSLSSTKLYTRPGQTAACGPPTALCPFLSDPALLLQHRGSSRTGDCSF